jgi:hypothetical protein
MRTMLVLCLVSLSILFLARSEPPASANEQVLHVFGDGVTDHTEAIQQLLNREGTVRFPKGVYRITRPLEINLDRTGPIALVADGNATLLMDGPGPGIRIVGGHEGTAAPKTLKAGLWEKQRTPSIVGLEFVGKHPEADAIEADRTMQLTLERVVIRQCRHGVHLINRNRNVLISACHFYDNRGIGVFLDRVNLHQIIVVGSHISYCRQGGIVSRGGEVRNLQIGTCDIEGCMSPTEAATANLLLDSRGGSIGEVTISGCTIQHESQSPNSANIRLLGEGVGGLPNVPGATREGHVTITGNVFSDVKVNVEIQNSRGVTLTGNTFWMGYDWNLKVEKSSQLIISNNVFERNPRYDYGTATTTKNALLFRDCEDCTMVGNHLHRVYGVDSAVVMENCNRLNVSDWSILDCDGVALHWKEVRNSRLSGCLIRNDLGNREAKSLKVEGGSGNRITHNLLGNISEISRNTGRVEAND